MIALRDTPSLFSRPFVSGVYTVVQPANEIIGERGYEGPQTEAPYLWVRTWGNDDDVRSEVQATLAEGKPLLTGLAYGVSPDRLLNKSGTLDDAPVKASVTPRLLLRAGFLAIREILEPYLSMR